jgi:hypothetical protein
MHQILPEALFFPDLFRADCTTTPTCIASPGRF